MHRTHKRCWRRSRIDSRRMGLASAAAAVQGDSKLGPQQLHSRAPREGDSKEYQSLVHGCVDNGDDGATFSQNKQDPILLSPEQQR
jgi:hypothetical protein